MLQPSLLELVSFPNDCLQQHLSRLDVYIAVTGDKVPTIVSGWIIMLRSDGFATWMTANLVFSFQIVTVRATIKKC